MKDKFADAKSRIRWAERDFENFEKSAKRFCQRRDILNPVAEPDPDGIHDLLKLKLAKPMPDSIAQRAFSVLENLRASLDIVTNVIADSLHIATNQTAFPFAKTESDFPSRLGSACKDFPQEILSLFKTFEPYQGGDATFWAMNELCRGSKHKIIAAQGVATFPQSIRVTSNSGARVPLKGWDSEKEELVYLIIPKGAKGDCNVRLAVAITFREIEGVKNRPVGAVLEYLVGKTKDVVFKTETLSKRLRLV